MGGRYIDGCCFAFCSSTVADVSRMYDVIRLMTSVILMLSAVFRLFRSRFFLSIDELWHVNLIPERFSRGHMIGAPKVNNDGNTRKRELKGGRRRKHDKGE